MTAYVPPYAPSLLDWQRQVSAAINPVFIKLGDYINIHDFSPAAGGGVSDDSAAFLAAIQAGGRIGVPAGSYRISSRVSATLTKDTVLDLSPDAKIIVDASMTLQAFIIDGTSQYSFKVYGGYFDSSGPNNTNPALDIGSIWDLNNLTSWVVRDGIYIAGTDYSTNKGDTAIDAVNCGAGHISGCYFRGWSDNAIYLTGGSSTGSSDDGGPTSIIGNYFLKNSCGVSVKRRNHNVIISNNTFDQDFVGFGTYEVSAGEIQPGDRLIVIGNTFIGNNKACGEMRGYGEFVFSGNTCRDWGYTLGGSVNGNPCALILSGSYNTNIGGGNIFNMRDKANTASHTAIVIQNYTVSPVTYTASNNYIAGNQCANVTNFIIEDAGVGANYALNNDCSSGVTNPFTFTNAGSQFSGVLSGGVMAIGATTATAATTGTNGAPPAQVLGYLIMNLRGTSIKVPYYAT